jgi:16S rRNA (adenine1518-N6/adenine1519-N6)-dimethyltransferase
MTHPGQLLKQANLYAGKELGQNFLSDPGLAKTLIQRTGIQRQTRVLEIGPGLGALTIPIAGMVPDITAVEKDRRMIGLLEQELAANGLTHVRIIHSDILKTDIQSLSNNKKLVVIGNLPYNISSQILFKLVEERSCIEKAFLMFQKELAQRILAAPGSKSYSRLSAVVQYAARVHHFADVRPSSFFPRPDVDSTILEFGFFEPDLFTPDEEKILFRVIKAAFSKRRKTLRNAMAGNELGLEKSQAGRLLEDAGIDPVRRAETLTVAEFVSIARTALQPDKGYSL